jgi:AcrR family transcriptional regulator
MARITSSAKQAVSERLLETAAEHFARDGLDGANVDAISLDAGFAKGTLYNYFRSKEELFAEVITEACRRAIETYSARERRHGTARERLLALAAADVEVLRREEGFVKVLIREAMSFREETYPLIIRHMDAFVGKVEEILSEGVKGGEIRNDRPVRQMAMIFVGILPLLYVQHFGTGGQWPQLDDVPDLAVTMFLDGAAQEEPRG